MNLPFVTLALLFTSVAVAFFVSFQLWQIYRIARQRTLNFAAELVATPAAAQRPRLLRDTRMSERPKLDDWLRTFSLLSRLKLLMSQSGIQMMADQFLWLSALLGVLAWGVLTLFSVTGWGAILGALLVTAVPILMAIYRKKKRLRAFDQQLPDFLDSVARAMQAGNSFSGAVLAVCKESPDPVGAEFKQLFDEVSFGSSLKDGLKSLSERIESEDVRFFVIAVLVQQQTGGSLTTLLLKLSNLIRDRQRLRKLGRVLSAEGRLSAWILGLLPFVTALLMYLVNPEFISVLWTNPSGLVLLQGTAIMMLVGVFWMWKVIHFRI